MVDPHLVEDEEVRKLKNWWQQNGTAIVFGVGLGLAAVVGYNWWQSYVQKRAEAASELYERLIAEVSDAKHDAAIKTGEQLLSDYQPTPYAANAALVLAQVAANNEDYSEAEKQLRWVLENPSANAVGHAARLRLANLMIADSRIDEAQALLKVDNQAGFESQYSEIAGDIFVAQGNSSEAATAFQKSIDTLPAGSRYAEILTMKLNNIRSE